MNSFLDSIGVGIAISLIFSVIFGFIAFMRYLDYKEKVELARRGLLPQPRPRSSRRGLSSDKWTRRGVVIFSLGVALFCGLFTIGLDGGNSILGPWLLGGLLPMAFGGSLIILDRMGRGDEGVSAENMTPYPDDDDPIPPHKAA